MADMLILPAIPSWIYRAPQGAQIPHVRYPEYDMGFGTISRYDRTQPYDRCVTDIERSA